MPNRIKELRCEQNLTQAELGKIINVSQRSVGFYESGDRDPDTDTLKKLADLFNCSIDYLLGQSKIRNLDEASKVLTEHKITLANIINDKEGQKLELVRNLKSLSSDSQKAVMKLADDYIAKTKNEAELNEAEAYKESDQIHLKNDIENKTLEIIDLIYSMKELSESDLKMVESLVEHLKAKNK